MLRGNLAPDGVVIKPSAVAPHLLRHTGRALVFDDERFPRLLHQAAPLAELFPDVRDRLVRHLIAGWRTTA
mgnify:CR=1 FL=1